MKLTKVARDIKVINHEQKQTFGGFFIVYIIVLTDKMNVSSLYFRDHTSPFRVPLIFAYPGSLKKGFPFKIKPCKETRTCSIVETPGVHFSFLRPDQVLSRLRHT
jgi:hypothetical protein